MQIREQLELVVNDALKDALAKGALELEEAPSAALERPRDESNGDWASTVAMRCAKQAKKNHKPWKPIMLLCIT